MGREYRKRVKEQYGRPTVLGTDLISLNAIQVSGIVGGTILRTGTSGVGSFKMPKPGFVDFILANTSPSVTAGSLGIALLKNNAVVASGTVNSTQPDRFEAFFTAEMGNELAFASGDVLAVNYAVSSPLSGVAGSTAISARLGLEYRDPA